MAAKAACGDAIRQRPTYGNIITTIVTPSRADRATSSGFEARQARLILRARFANILSVTVTEQHSRFALIYETNITV